MGLKGLVDTGKEIILLISTDVFRIYTAASSEMEEYTRDAFTARILICKRKTQQSGRTNYRRRVDEYKETQILSTQTGYHHTYTYRYMLKLP